MSLVAGGLLVAPAPFARAQSVVSDENGPKVSILAPAYQDILKGKAKILVGIVAGQYNPSTIELWVDDRAVTRQLPLSEMASMSFDWDTHRFPDGPHKLTIRVTDTQGFRGLGEVNIYINNENKHDLAAPDLKWKNVEAFQALSGQAEIGLEAKNSFGVKWVIVKVTPLDKNNKSKEPSWMLGGGETKIKFDTTKVADGLYAVTAKAWDALEQEGNAQTLTIGVVNSPLNATTIGESLDGLRKMAEIEARKNPSKGNAAPLPRLPKIPVAPAPPVASAELLPDVTPRISTSSTTSDQSVVGGLKPLFVPRFEAPTPKTPKKNLPRVAGGFAYGNAFSARPSEGILSSSGSPLVTPARSLVSVKSAPSLPKTFVARLAKPAEGARETPSDAALSAPEVGTKSAISPAQTPDAGTRATGTTRVEIARLSLPANESRTSEGAPSLSSEHAPQSVASLLAPVQSAIERMEHALVVSAPAPSARAKRRAPSHRSPLSKVGMTIKRGSAPVNSTIAAPQLSSPHGESTTISTRKVTPSPLSRVVPRFSALPSRPKPGISDAVPGEGDHPAITVSPIQTAFDSALPKQHLVKKECTLKDVADHYGLSVEIVAAANNWNPNMRVIPGMVVLLPRQVQLSLNGKKVGGDVASMVIGDTTMTAMRFLFEQNGGKLEWDAAKQEVIARKGDSTVRVKIGSKVAHVNDKAVMMQLAAFLFEGRTMVPARFFEEGLNAQVEWNPQTGHLVVAMVG